MILTGFEGFENFDNLNEGIRIENIFWDGRRVEEWIRHLWIESRIRIGAHHTQWWE